jgi:PAS domain S-box-containing protein
LERQVANSDFRATVMLHSYTSHEASLTHRAVKDLRSVVPEKIAVAELARELAHELNNPLEALVNLIYLARQKPLDDETRAMLDEAESQLGRMSVVVHTILALEKSNHEQRLRTAGTLLDSATFQRIKQEYESALHLASIVEGAQDAIYSKKLDGTIMAWNAGAKRLFGYSAQEALGKSVMMLVPPELSQEERGIFEEIRAGRLVEHFETVRRTKDGKDVRVSVSVSPIRNPRGRVVGASTIARAIRPEVSEG